MGYHFYEHVRHMINDRGIDWNEELALKITYPTFLNTSHFYSYYQAAKAISQIPIELFCSSMTAAADGMTPLKISI